MRNPNGHGTIYKMSGKRRKPWRAMKIVELGENTGNYKRITIGYYKTRKEGIEALSHYIVNPYNFDSEHMTLKMIYDTWKKQAMLNIAERTVIGYNNSYRQLKSIENEVFSKLKFKELQNLFDNLDISESSKRPVKSLLNMLYKYALKNEIVTKDYSKLIELGKMEKVLKRQPFTQEEINKLWELKELATIDTVLIMIYTGLRIGELLNIKNNDIDLIERTLRAGSKTEAEKNRLIPLNHKVLPLIKARMSPSSEYLIINKKGKKISYRTYLTKWFSESSKHFLIKHTIHDCRHTFATLLNNANANTTTIKKIIGHSSFETTEKIYTHKDIEELKKAVDLL
ncbi:MAG: tyrosine-type recombinase/integrase [Fusobacterium varium]|uniref:tyrosine-type recombinase/integrase n=1 Tax=Fusobacterium varium TaxID=856 RepID=UPI00242F6AB7|nr:tyrosine-type recombinase/integrase [Fusobacterium varium]UYI77618.1 MAG: tyrosine-type recombinase/integrase [Fusobacterium varium]